MKSTVIGLCAALGLTVSMSASAMPNIDKILFDNDTDISLDATIAGKPGKPIPAHSMNHAVPYALVYVACQYSGVLNNCPIEFTNSANGEKVARVVLNAEEVSVVEAPVFYGNYGDNYSVSGWDLTPADHIKISEK